MAGLFRDTVDSVGRTLAGTLDFSGRARRLDVAYYWLAATLISVVLNLAAGWWLEWTAASISQVALSALVAIPMFALFVRRAHDQDRSGWWMLILPLIVAMNIYQDVRFKFQRAGTAWPGFGYWSYALLIPALIVLVIIVMPGTIGTNRYGTDPRESGG